jgi:hypothetical protein
VIIILVTIVAAAIPIMSPSNDDRRIREATRGLNTFITGAQARAIARGRPYGIQLKRLSADTGRTAAGDIDNDNAVCLEAFYVEQPAPYAGFDVNSRVRVARYMPQNMNWYGRLRPLALIQFVTRGSNVLMMQDGLPTGWDADQFPDGMIRPGDVIEVAGTRYQLLADPADDNVVARLVNSVDPTKKYFAKNTGRAGDDANKPIQIVARPINNNGQLLYWQHDDRGNALRAGAATANAPFFTAPAPYKILRQPSRTSDEPYQLPEGTGIDLRASGVGTKQFFYNMDPSDSEQRIDNPYDVTIMFAPEGRIARVVYSRLAEPNRPKEVETFDDPVVENVYLLVGRRASIPAPRAADNSSTGDATLDRSRLQTAGAVNNEEKLQELKGAINWLSGTSRWIVIGAQSGRVVTVENAFVDVPELLTNPPADLGERRNQQILAAREFTREMSQLGGR